MKNGVLSVLLPMFLSGLVFADHVLGSPKKAGRKERDYPRHPDRAGPFLACPPTPWLRRACRNRSGWKDEKTAPTEATGSILARGREGKAEILA